MAEETNIIVIFTQKSDEILTDIIQRHNLRENVVIVDHLAGDFARGKISEKGISDYLQKELKLDSQTAEQITKEVITNLVPTLKKISEEELAKLSEEEKDALMYGPVKKTEEPAAMPKMKAPIEVEKILAEKQAPPFKEKKEEAPIKKAPAKGPDAPRKTERPAPRQPRKPDSYREPIE